MRSFEQCFSHKIIIPAIILIYWLIFGVLFAQARILIDSANISKSQIELFEKDLRAKTGLQSLGFNEENELDYDVWETAKYGSQKMREGIIGAIDDELNIFKIRNYPNAKDIHFARTDAGTVDIVTKITTYEIKFDFADFHNAGKNSDIEALESFTLAINLFHEIDHKVSYDISSPIPMHKVRSEIRVRENVNFTRKELGLILRDTKRVLGRKYHRDVYEIPFVDRLGRRKFLRWRIKRK